MRSDADLRWRVAERFQVTPDEFSGLTVLDAGAGAGDQSRWLIEHGARVVSIDLSPAIDVVARKLRLHPAWVGIQGDITALPFFDEAFDMVYCEGVIQHTRDSEMTVRELCRVLRQGGSILATHYAKATRRPGRVKEALLSGLRARLSRWERYRLLLLTGCFAAMAYVPLIGYVVRRSGVAVHYDLMPDFRTTWTNTFDFFGDHAFQRHVTPEEFWGYFERVGDLEPIFRSGTIVNARKRGHGRHRPPGPEGCL